MIYYGSLYSRDQTDDIITACNLQGPKTLRLRAPLFSKILIVQEISKFSKNIRPFQPLSCHPANM